MGEWSVSLFSCFDNMKVCIITLFLPCYTMGKVAESVGESCCLHGCLFPFLPIAGFWCPVAIRGMIRSNKGIEGSCLMDCLTLWCCAYCALCQEYNEMGIDGMGRE